MATRITSRRRQKSRRLFYQTIQSWVADILAGIIRTSLLFLELLFLYPRLYPGKNLADAMAYYRPDILVIDGFVEPYINDTLDPSERWYDYRISRAELYDFLAKHGEHVFTPETVLYYDEPVLVYRINWEP